MKSRSLDCARDDRGRGGGAKVEVVVRRRREDLAGRRRRCVKLRAGPSVEDFLQWLFQQQEAHVKTLIALP